MKSLENMGQVSKDWPDSVGMPTKIWGRPEPILPPNFNTGLPNPTLFRSLFRQTAFPNSLRMRLTPAAFSFLPKPILRCHEKTAMNNAGTEYLLQDGSGRGIQGGPHSVPEKAGFHPEGVKTP
jgi:hypothetical protein